MTLATIQYKRTTVLTLDIDELVLQHSQLRSRLPVPPRNIRSVRSWFRIHKGAIQSGETDYINHEDDVFQLVPREKSPLRQLLERSAWFHQLKIWRTQNQPTDKYVYYTSETRIDQFVNNLIMILGLAMLITPLWLLAFVQDYVKRLVIITVFVITFLCLVSLTSVARPFETLAAGAA